MRVLVVDDEKKIADSIKRGLEQERFAVDVAYDGEEGYDLASMESYDVIVLDVMMPKMDGFEVCRKLREDENHTAILMLTAKGEVEDKVAGLNVGADDYLPKPFAFEELVARIKALTRRPKETVPSKLKAADLELDTATFEVKRGEKPIELSKKEFALLEFLLRHKDKVLSKDQIIQNVWDYESDVLPNTVEVYIKYLRKKIDAGAKPLIETIRGFGYKLKSK
jgi:two-component system, OmpR family, response regulator